MIFPRWFFGFLISCAWLLSGCGFEPIYATPGNEAASLPGVAVETAPRGREAQILKIAAEDRLNPSGRIPADPGYHLGIGLARWDGPAVIAGSAAIRRYDVHIIADFTLTRLSDGKNVLSGQAQRVGAYNASRQFYSDYVAAQDTAARTIQELGVDIAMRVQAYLKSHEAAN